jgi:hypothetical protein
MRHYFGSETVFVYESPFKASYVCAHRTAILVWYMLLFKHFQTAILVLYVLLFKHVVRNLSVIIHPLIQHRSASKQAANPTACTEVLVIPRFNPLPVPLSAPLYFRVCPLHSSSSVCVLVAITARMTLAS